MKSGTKIPMHPDLDTTVLNTISVCNIHFFCTERQEDLEARDQLRFFQHVRGIAIEPDAVFYGLLNILIIYPSIERITHSMTAPSGTLSAGVTSLEELSCFLEKEL